MSVSRILASAAVLAAVAASAAAGPGGKVAGGRLGPQFLRDQDRGVVVAERVAAAAGSPQVRVRLQAVRVLASAGDPSRAGLLRRFVKDPAVAVRRAAQLASGRMGVAAEEWIRRGLRDRDAGVRAAAVWAAVQLGKEAPPRLRRLAERERDPRVLEQLAANLWRLPEDWRSALAPRLLASDSVRVLRGLAAGLGRTGSFHPELRRLAGHKEVRVRALALLGLARGRPVDGDREAVLAALAGATPEERVAALTVLARRTAWRLGREDGERLLRLLDDPAPHVRVMAVRALGHHPEVKAVTRLERIADGPDPWPAAEALEVLVRRGARGGDARVALWLDAKPRWRREAAARCVGLAPERFAASLGRLLKDPEPAVRLAWIEASAEGGEPDGEALHGFLEDPDPAVRAAALEALEASRPLPVPSLLALARKWRADEVADARVAALVQALRRSRGRAARRGVLRLALSDPSPLVGTAVANAARALGLTASPGPRPSAPPEFYRETWRWAGEARALDVVTVRGTVRLRLEPELAPLTCRRIWDLAASGFYDGLTFHRVVPDFVVQGGDPRGDGWGSGGLLLPDEPSLAPFARGGVGIATSGPNTGGCQLFAMLLDAPHLVGHYTRFAHVEAGEEVLSRIRRWDTIRRVECREGSDLPPVTPVLLGPLEPSELLDLPGWRREFESYTPDGGGMDRLRAALRRGAALRVVVVLGTWCSDSRREVPRLLRIVADAGEGSGLGLEMEGVDRTLAVEDPAWDPSVLPGRRPEAVPTMVVLGPAGEELARVVETAGEPLELILARAAEEVAP